MYYLNPLLIRGWVTNLRNVYNNLTLSVRNIRRQTLHYISTLTHNIQIMCTPVSNTLHGSFVKNNIFEISVFSQTWSLVLCTFQVCESSDLGFCSSQLLLTTVCTVRAATNWFCLLVMGLKTEINNALLSPYDRYQFRLV